MPNSAYRVIIAGSRSFNNYNLLREHCLSLLHDKMQQNVVVIVSGHAHGADLLGERFAKEFGLSCERHPANWKAFGKAAGLIRNAEMAKYADALIAFWDGKSRGTSHMINFAKRKGLDVSIIDYTRIRKGDITTPGPKQSESASLPLDETQQKTNNTSFKR